MTPATVPTTHTDPAAAIAAHGFALPGSVPGALADAEYRSVPVARTPAEAGSPEDSSEAGSAWSCRDLATLGYALFALAEPVPLAEVRPLTRAPLGRDAIDPARASLDARPCRQAMLGEISALDI